MFMAFPSIDSRRGGFDRARNVLLLVLALLVNALPSTVARAQDVVAPAQPPESAPLPPAGPGDAPEPGQSRGMTLDQALQRLERSNLRLAAQRLEIPQARADVVTAGQHARSYVSIGGNAGPGAVRLRPVADGPKRWARVLAARLAAQVVEAQYEDAVRNQTGSLYTAFVDVQQDQQHTSYARAAVKGAEWLVRVVKILQGRDQVDLADVLRTVAEQQKAAATLEEAEAALRKARLTLADLLNLPDAEAERLEVRGLDPDETAPPCPAVEELTRLALANRPDVRAYRLGLLRAQADWLRTWLEQMPDVYVSTPPPGRPGARGLWVALPDTGHQRGAVERARINVVQTRIELAEVERRVAVDVRQARLGYESDAAVVRRLRGEVIPVAKNVRDHTYHLYMGGEANILTYLNAQREYNETVEAYLKAITRQRRSALALDTAVGRRVLP
jgi:cobalt-zinc-cadmium efflux system outer membrane protein